MVLVIVNPQDLAALDSRVPHVCEANVGLFLAGGTYLTGGAALPGEKVFRVPHPLRAV
jgi:hypothetical protein